MADHRTYEDFRKVLTDTPLPAAILDEDALEHNLGVLLAALGPGLTLRIASKSIRVPEVMRRLLARTDRLRGLMTFSAHETAWLARQGFDDLLLAYPIGRPDEARALAEAAADTGADLIVTVDAPAQVALLAEAAAAVGVHLPLCLDVDASWRPGLAGGRVHLGVRRSPIRGGDAAVALARDIARHEAVSLQAVLAYEAQVAGLQDRSAAGPVMDAVGRLVKRVSIPRVAQRRAEVLEALAGEGVTPRVVNGGGTGSVRSTSADPTVTEVTAGSGFVCPHLFDGYDDLPLHPALFFALGVVRHSDPDHLTCAGGGYVASGPVGADRLPVVHLPRGLEPVGIEGFGEVQTPLVRGPDAPPLGVGDPVICRHAKAGELAERFAHYHLLRGDRLADTVATYRGLGQAFF